MPIAWKKWSGTVVVDDKELNVSWRWLVGGDPILDEDRNLLIDPASQSTFLIAKLNHEWVGQLQSGHYDLHAEEVLLEALQVHWQALLAEKVVWRPTRESPRNLLSIKLTRSPCDENGHGCGEKLISFLRAMNLSTSAREEDIQKYNPMRVNWNLHMRVKVRTLYNGKPSSDENREKSKQVLRRLIENGILVRPWMQEATVIAQKKLRKGTASTGVAPRVHETAYLTKSFFKERVVENGSKSQTRSSKLDTDIKKLDTVLNAAYAGRYPGEFATSKGNRQRWSSFGVSHRTQEVPEDHLRAFALVTVRADIEQKLETVLKQMVTEFMDAMDASWRDSYSRDLQLKQEQLDANETKLLELEQRFFQKTLQELTGRLQALMTPR